MKEATAEMMSHREVWQKSIIVLNNYFRFILNRSVNYALLCKVFMKHENQRFQNK